MSPLRKRLGRFARWFFDVSPTLALDDEPSERVAERRAAVARLGATPIEYRRRPPTVGEHNAEVYAEFGIAAARLASLRAERVV